MEVAVFHPKDTLTINSPLLDVIVDKPDIYEMLIAKIKEDKNKSLNNQIGWAAGSVFSAAFCVTGAFLLTNASHGVSLGLMGIGFGGCVISGITFVAIGIPLSTRLEANSEIVRVSDLFSGFLETFSAFKSEPTENDLTILFNKFEDLSVENLLDNEQLFSGTGKLLLMDKVVKVLMKKIDEKKIISTIPDEWESLLKCNQDIFKGVEPWSRLKIENPTEDFYTLFRKEREKGELKIKIVKEMKKIFNKMIEGAFVVAK